jgi:isocitrate dehydrogenase (NAD+)
MPTHLVTLIPGDGIGPEVTAATLRVIEAAGIEIDWDYQIGGAAAVEQFGSPTPPALLDSIRRTGTALKGPLTTPIGGGFRSANVTIRQELELFSNLRPVKTVPNVKSHFNDVDLIIVRENSEGLYAGLEHKVAAGVMTATRVITEKASRRIAKWAFEHARANGRKRVTCVHKANIMKLTDGLFLNCFNEESAAYPEIKADNKIVDALCMDLVMDPGRYDVLVLENLFGDIVSDLCAGLVGGLGIVPGANIGERCAVFEAVHGSAPDIAGKNVANPSALMFSAVLMLRHLGETSAADKIENAIHAVFKNGKILTRDLGGHSGTQEFTNEIVAEIARN